MQNEEIIYQITRTIYEKLGSSTNPELVKDLVAEIFHVVQPAFGGVFCLPSDSSSADNHRAVISVFGQDGSGIIAAIAQVLAETKCSIVDINQTVLSGKFAMILIADTSNLNCSFTDLQQKLKEVATQVGVKAYLQREDLFHSMHRV